MSELELISPVEFVRRSRQYHLTIGNVLEFPIDEVKRIYFLDRNMFDSSLDKSMNFVGKPTKPSEFFRYGYFVDFIRKSGIQGIWKWDYIGVVDDQKEGQLEEFDIDLGNCWYPLKDDCVPVEDNQGIFKIPDNFSGKHWRELPTNTRLGWRGPSMLAENMDKCGMIVWSNDEE